MKKRQLSRAYASALRLTKIALLMKMAFVIILATCLQASANGFGQEARLTLNLKQVPISKVLKTIERQTDYKFVYSSNLFPSFLTVNVQVKEALVSDILSMILDKTGFTYKKIDEDLIVITNRIQSVTTSPQASVSGKVSNSKGEALPGVTVAVEGGGQQTATDASGNFTIEAPNNATLVFSSVGYVTQRIAVGNRSVINITLTEAANDLNEVVVIGYGNRQKKDITGAVSSVASKDIEKSTAMTPELALQGRAAGVFIESGGGDPQARPTVRIRGVNTFGYAEPLYVIDGLPIYEGGSGVTGGAIGDIRSPINVFSMINPGDIESISVLKDASAAAIYGVRASNGVILITTKKGRTGKPRVEVSASYGIQNSPKTIPVLNTQQYFGLVREAYAANPDANTTFEQKFGPLYTQGDPSYVGNGPTYDWQKELLNRNAPMTNTSVKLSGGNESTTYYLSVGYSKTESPLKANDLERYTIATNVESKISKVISVGLNLRLIKEDAYINTGTDLGTMMSTIPFQPFYDPSDPTGFAPVAAGSFEPNPDYDPSLLSPGAPFNFVSGDPRLLWGIQTRFNPFAWHQLNSNDYELLRSLGSAYVQIEPIKGLRIKGTLGGDYYINLRKSWTDLDSWRFSQTPGNPYAGQDGNSAGSYGERQGKTYNLNKELTATYNHTFANKHNIDVLLSASEQFARWTVNDLSGQVNYRELQFRAIQNQPPYTQGFANILTEDALIGYVGRISYKYNDKYYVDATLRYDGSSRLAPGNKWDYFPSFALAWRISSEDFFPKASFISDLKLRGGWGQLGNVQSAGQYKFLSGISLTPDYSLGSGNGDPFGQQVQSVALPDFANTTLTWEKAKTISAGFDALLFNNRVSFTAEYYNKETFDIIQSVSLPPNTGIQNPADLNIAKVRNSGIELQLGYTGKVGPVDFSVNGNLTTVKNRVLKLNEGTPLGGEGGRIEEGYSMFYLWGYKVGGIFQTQQEIDAWRKAHADVTINQNLANAGSGYAYQPGDMYFQDVYGNPVDPKTRYSLHPDSLINSNDRTYLGKTIPGYFYGFNFSGSYKGLDLSIFFQGVGDVQKYNYLRQAGETMSGLGNQWTTVLNRWTPTNPSTTMPRAVYNNQSNLARFSDRYVENAGYLRLKNLQLGYSLPKTWMNKIGFVQSFRLYVSAVNLFTITPWTGVDPENDVIPPTKQFVFGVNAAF